MISSLLVAFVASVGPFGLSPQVLQTDSLSGTREVPDSVRLERARGRHWHAVRRLREAFPDGPGADADLVLLFAETEAGWSNWSGVRSLLENRLALGELEGGEAWYLLGRAWEAEGSPQDAETAYSRVVGGGEGQDSPRYRESLARRARIRGGTDQFSSAFADLRELNGLDSNMAGWLALELAERTAAQGFKDETLQTLSLVGDHEVRRLGWNLPPIALLAAGDSIGAEAAFWSALPALTSNTDRAAAWDRVGTLRLARGDSVGARGAFHQVLSLSSAGGVGLRAADALLELGFDSVGVALAGARALAGAGRHEDALEAYDVFEELLGEPPDPTVLLARTRSLMSLGQAGRALPLATQVSELDDPEVGGAALVIRIRALRALGRGGEVRAAQEELMDRFPNRAESVEILFLRADALEDRGDPEGAIRAYQATTALAPAQNLAGQARMRMGQILMGLGRDEEAVEVYAAYLNDFPDGRRADEAGFWAGRLLLSLGREPEAREILSTLRAGYPLSYYSVQAGDLLGEGYAPAIPSLPDSLPFPAFLKVGMERFDDYMAAGLDRGAVFEWNRLATRIRSDPDTERRQANLLRLALELNSRGFTREGINLGWELRRDNRPWDRQLLSSIYPFPYREIILAEAEERRVDPYLMAGLIRQESAFWVRARSRADARGLMQVLPTTGRELARSSGPSGFRPDDHLYEAEINIHLGTAFFSDMRRRFGEDLPIILSAYNAGPSRALRWRQYPEAKDMPRFVERIPFTETRGYVKNVTANRAIYTWLYAPSSADSSTNGSKPPHLP